MAQDPRSYVRPGDRLRVAASQINALNAMMRPNAGFRDPDLPGYQPLNTIIMARNATGSDVDRWGVMKITGVEIDPNDGDTERRSFEGMPCITGESLSGDLTNKVAVAVEPIKIGKIGRVAVAGVVQITKTSLDAVRQHVSVMWEGTDWAIVRIGANPVRLGKTTTAWNKGTAATIELYSQGLIPAKLSPTQTITNVVNLSRNVPANVFVIIGLSREGQWYLIEAESYSDTCGRSTENILRFTVDGCFGGGASGVAHITGDCPGAITSLEITNHGSGYAIPARGEPSATVTGSGLDATFTPTFTETVDECGVSTWSITGCSVSGGTGYSDGETLSIEAAFGTHVVAEAVLTLNATEGVPASVTVTMGGTYYADSDSAPYTADVTVNLTQESPSAGSGASFTAHVNITPGADFGSISSIDINDGGTGYFDRKYAYESTFAGMKFSSISGFDGSVTQILGHDPGGCLKWFSVKDCDPNPPGVCCIGGSEDSDYTTQADCEGAGGTWKPGAASDELPGPCCT